ncbi:vasorin-like [Mytilus edulis]|uniref:vasorin-like n=1 Tax=Mytilus edulis TaxID=6550 RepID=UPI0039EF5E05
MIIGTKCFNMIVVLTLGFSKVVYAQGCTEPTMFMCDCSEPTLTLCRNRNFTQIPNLPADSIQLIFSQNKISSIKDADFSGLLKLNILDLNNNEITRIENGAFSDIHTLGTLKLQHNKISSIEPDSFTGLPNLTGLDLSFNNLTTVKANMFDRVARLLLLLLNNNPLSCCTMGDFFEWKSNQTHLKVFRGTCHDFNTTTDILSFDLSNCPVNGQWGSWSTGPCSVTCGQGIRYRNRRCDSPPASNNGQYCIGSSTDSLSCTLAGCRKSCKKSRKKAV